MGCLEIILISIGLAMDAFAVSVCKGVQIRKLNYDKMIIVGLYFGSFQAIMPRPLDSICITKFYWIKNDKRNFKKR